MEWKDDPQVPMVPQVSYDTMLIVVRYVPIPTTSAVFTGSGTVWENLTCRLPVLNPKYPQHCGTGSWCVTVWQSPTPYLYLQYLFWEYHKYYLYPWKTLMPI